MRPGLGPHRRRDQLDRAVVEAPPHGRPGAGRDAGQGGRRAELRAHDVRVEVAEQLLPGLDQQAQPELVGHRPGRGEQPGLVTKELCDVRLQAVDRRVLAVDVVTDGCSRHRGAHRGGRRGDRVAAQVDEPRAGGRVGHRSPSISAVRKASSRDCWWLSRGSQAVS